MHKHWLEFKIGSAAVSGVETKHCTHIWWNFLHAAAWGQWSFHFDYRVLMIVGSQRVYPEWRGRCLTSFILAALNDGVRMLRTLFHLSFLKKSRQSARGLVTKREDCAETHVRHKSDHTVSNMCMLRLVSSPFCLGSWWSPSPSPVSVYLGLRSPRLVCGPNNTWNFTKQ